MIFSGTQTQYTDNRINSEVGNATLNSFTIFALFQVIELEIDNHAIT
jgi:hypothetical protein